MRMVREEFIWWNFFKTFNGDQNIIQLGFQFTSSPSTVVNNLVRGPNPNKCRDLVTPDLEHPGPSSDDGNYPLPLREWSPRRNVTSWKDQNENVRARISTPRTLLREILLLQAHLASSRLLSPSHFHSGPRTRLLTCFFFSLWRIFARALLWMSQPPGAAREMLSADVKVKFFVGMGKLHFAKVPVLFRVRAPLAHGALYGQVFSRNMLVEFTLLKTVVGKEVMSPHQHGFQRFAHLFLGRCHTMWK